MGPASLASVDSGEWPLVGRDDELALAVDAVVRRRGVVLTGAAGVGKSRLGREVVARATRAGDRVEWIAATAAAAQVPLGAAAHLIPSDAVGGGRDAVLRAIASTFHREAGRGRLLLGVDDAHLLDDASSALVHLLSATGVAALVVTLRSGESAPDSITALWKDGPLSMLAVQALSRVETEQLVATVLDGPVDGAVLHRLWNLSAGNPLYLKELVRHGMDSGALRFHDGIWRWPERFEPGQRLRDIVALRMGTLSDGERDVLELVAVGEPLTSPVLRALGVAETATRLERRGVLASGGTNATETRLAHPLFGEVVRDRMPRSRLDAVRRQLADSVEVTNADSPGDTFRCAVWRADVGDRTRPGELTAAARRAWALWDAVLSERLARAALESGPDLEAGYVLGQALSRQGHPEEALAAFETASELPGPDELRATVAIAQAGVLHHQLRRAGDAALSLREAHERLRDDTARRWVEGAMAAIGAGPSLADGTDPVAAARASPHSALAAGTKLVTQGRFELAVQTLDEAIAREAGWAEWFPTATLRLHLTRVWATVLSGSVRDAEAEADRGYTEAVLWRDDYPRIGWCLMRGMAALLRGRVRHAADALREGVAVMGSDDRGFGRPLYAYLTMAAAMAGDVATAEASVRQAVDANRSVDVFALDVARAMAWVRAARGELTAAASEATAAADQAAGARRPVFEALALHDLVRFGRAADVADRLSAVADTMDGSLVVTFAAHARAAAANDGRALDAVSAAFASLGCDIFAAEASAAAAGSHRDAGRSASGFASRDLARVLASRCEGAHTPILSWADTAADLTGREREVADLAVAGLSSRAIAERLGISRRTVDNLLGRVYVKTGVSGRNELVAVLGRRE